MPKGIYPRPMGYRPRKTDDPLLIATIRAEYEAGASQAELAQVRGWSLRKVQGFFRRNQIQPRPQVKRNQWGPNNPRWKGQDASYVSMHDRVYRLRGKAMVCSKCGTTDGTMDWANLTGDYNDPMDYAAMCRSCHRQYDNGRSTRSAQTLSEERAAP